MNTRLKPVYGLPDYFDDYSSRKLGGIFANSIDNVPVLSSDHRLRRSA